MRCPNCGQELRDEDKFCASCGAPRPLETTPDPYGEPFGDPYGGASTQPRPNVSVNLPPPVAQPVPAPRSFVTQAVITLVLYWFLWIPGLIANIIFWNEANQVKRETGHNPDGKGCLVALFIVFGVFPILLTCSWLAIAAST